MLFAFWFLWLGDADFSHEYRFSMDDRYYVWTFQVPYQPTINDQFTYAESLYDEAMVHYHRSTYSEQVADEQVTEAELTKTKRVFHAGFALGDATSRAFEAIKGVQPTDFASSQDFENYWTTLSEGMDHLISCMKIIKFTGHTVSLLNRLKEISSECHPALQRKINDYWMSRMATVAHPDKDVWAGLQLLQDFQRQSDSGGP